MKDARLIHQAGDGSSTWVVTVSYDDASPSQSWTFTASQSADVVVYYDSIVIEKDSVDVTPAISEDSCTLYLRDAVQYFPQPYVLSPEVFGIWALFWAFVVSRLLR